MKVQSYISTTPPGFRNLLEGETQVTKVKLKLTLILPFNSRLTTLLGSLWYVFIVGSNAGWVMFRSL